MGYHDLNRPLTMFAYASSMMKGTVSGSWRRMTAQFVRLLIFTVVTAVAVPAGAQSGPNGKGGRGGRGGRGFSPGAENVGDGGRARGGKGGRGGRGGRGGAKGASLTSVDDPSDAGIRLKNSDASEGSCHSAFDDDEQTRAAEAVARRVRDERRAARSVRESSSAPPCYGCA